MLHLLVGRLNAALVVTKIYRQIKKLMLTVNWSGLFNNKCSLLALVWSVTQVQSGRQGMKVYSELVTQFITSQLHKAHWFLSCKTCYVVQIMNNCTRTRAVDERTFVCIEEAPSLWPPGTVCQCGTWAWAQSNASSWHCAYDTSNTLNYVQLTVMHVLILILFSACFLVFNLCI